MPRDAAIRFADMLEFATKANRKALSTDKDAFLQNEDLQIVVSHWILLLGEAAARVDESIRAQHPQLPWQQMLGMRNRIVHEYFAIDTEVLWQTAAVSLPPLIEQLKMILEGGSPRSGQ
ncbi:MAG: DUF86 domain-containing protein [Planctomycetota bacterium]